LNRVERGSEIDGSDPRGPERLRRGQVPIY